MERQIVDLTSRLVAIPTHETASDAQALLAERMTALGFDCNLHEIFPGHANLVAVRGTGGPLLCSHVDVHPPHAHHDPWTATHIAGTLVGRGVVDAKGQIAALVAAAAAVPDAPAIVLITSDEETTGFGSQRATLPAGLDRSAGGVVLEPTSFVACTAQAGCIELALRVSAQPSHAYATDRATSAIDVLQGAIDALRECAFLRRRHPRLPAPDLLTSTLGAGEHPWRTPAHATATVALGLVPGLDPSTALEEATETLDALATVWRTEGITLAYDVLDSSDAIEISEDLPVVHRLLRSGAIAVGGMSSWTDASNLLLHPGLPCVVFGAGELTTAHSDRESVAVSDLVRLGGVLARFLAG